VSTAAPPLYLLPASVFPAAENMALDWLMLEEFPEPDAARLRFYGWAQRAFTFGYGQRWAEVCAVNKTNADLIRRPTGGGLVDHRSDWTYALVLPAAHTLAQARACESYKKVHETLAEAMGELSVPGRLQPGDCAKEAQRLAVCFEKPEPFDLIRIDNKRKIAGAAQKRTKKGLLLQGAVERTAAGEVNDWDKFGEIFAHKLAVALHLPLQPWFKNDWLKTSLLETAARFAAPDWNEKR
jgi:lipoate-protein ligase A